MPNERENLVQPLTFVDYDIAANVFRAYYDADNKVVFVIDYTISDIKPNVLLVINPVGNRKWDDILMNDYGVDLETVRPKKDNKYQKLDIEYVGLAQYDDLVRAYDSDGDVVKAVNALAQFRRDAAYRAALERLGEAEITAEKARETISKTNDTVHLLQDKLRKLRAKLAEHKRGIGKEPAKQSAAKILRVESQIEVTGEKLARAKKRLISAQRRLDAAETDAEVAREILGRIKEIQDLGEDDALPVVAPSYNVAPVQPVGGEVTVVKPVPVPVAFDDATDDEDLDEQDFITETKVDEMADDEVKPLFDEDPKILDDEIAFKPIDFGTPVAPVAPVAPVDDVNDGIVGYNEDDLQPLSFVPPVMNTPVVQESAEEDFVVPAPVASPVLNSITAVNAPVENIDSELMAEIDEPMEYRPVSPMASPVSAPAPVENVVAPLPSEPEIADAPISSDFRPVSPVAAADVAAPVPVSGRDERRKPTVLYYVLLIILVVLSVFTLWLYQQTTNKNMPELGAETKVAPDVAAEQVQDTPKVEVAPVVEVEKVEVQPVVVEPEVSQPVEAQPLLVVEPTPLEVTEPEPVEVVVEEDVVEIQPVVEPEEPESPFLSDEVVAPAKTKSVEEILASKPAYNVSQQEKMFVADEEYDTGVPEALESDNVVEEVNANVVDVPEVAFTEPTIVSAPETQVFEEQFVTEETVETCSDGAMPDANGCCGGEEFVDFGGGEYACCVVGTDECFPPMV